MPKLGFDMAEGTLVRWVKAKGDEVKKGEVLAEIETDKATVEVESTYDGVIARLLVDEGSVVPVGDPIAVVGAPGEEVPEDVLTPSGEEPEAGEGPEEGTGVREQQPAAVSEETEAELQAKAPEPGQVEGGEDGVIRASPVARRIADEHGLSISNISGSGPGGRVIKRDVEAALEEAEKAPEKAPAPAAQAAAEAAPARPQEPRVALPAPAWQAGEIEPPADQEVELSRLRAAIGRRMVESRQQVPDFYVTHVYKFEKVMDLRKQINNLLPEEEKLSVNDFVVKAVALTLRRFPNLNASIDGNKVIRHGAVNVGNAVAVENGLLTVVVKNADVKPLRVIASELKQMVARVREGKVRSEDIEGSTFSISNLGMFDVEDFVAIINPPEAAILAVSSAQQVPVVEDGEIKVGMRMRATISADHRVTDGAEAAQFMQALEDYLHNPMTLLL
jgi:pyruvate dehydrogenase E2 component (dihydrolipoamide acetyltransferase)